MAVCGIHVTASWNDLLRVGLGMVVFRQLINFPVAVFVFLAGYFVDEAKLRADRRGWVLSRCRRLLVPYLFLWLATVAWNYGMGNRLNWKGLLAGFLLGSSEVQLYYVPMLLQLILLTPLLVRWARHRAFRIGAVSLSLLIAATNLTEAVSLPVPAGFLGCTWGGFYVCGLYARQVRGAGQEPGKKRRAVLLCRAFVSLAAAAAAAAAALCFYAKVVGGQKGYAIGQIRPLNFLYLLFLVEVLSVYATRVTGQLVESGVWILFGKLGRASFGIYLIHMLVLRVCERLLPDGSLLGKGSGFPVLAQVSVWGLVLFFSYGLVLGSRRLLAFPGKYGKAV
jgi:surface polysaccharide O-acyltransferase-like enzyme